MDHLLPPKHPTCACVEAMDFALAIEYSGPPIPYEIPQAIPIEIERIPVASVVSPAFLSDHHSIPVVQPLPSPTSLKKSDVSSPTSVIENHIDVENELSSELKGSGVSSEEEEYEEVRGGGETIHQGGERDRVDEEFVRLVKKGACCRCLKGNRFTEKEFCLVCDLKYCSGCVLKAMGSMPEGRKCVPCIGGSVDESKRERLGNASRMLRRLLSSLEVEQAMKAEKYCEANQLRPEDVCVNGKPLTHDEIFMLQSSPCPPAKLRPGYYWYDKVSGFWGKVGHKPDKIISPNLNVGGSIMRNASNGNSGILINGREITKVELQMLKWAGVQCAGNPHFWVNSDGTYQEEGQKNIKGQIWGGARTKLLCSFLSLPVPPKAVKCFGEEVNITLNKAMHDFIEQRTTQKLLLVGSCGSGSSTLFKQAKFLYKRVPFTEDELQNMKLKIQTNIYSYLGLLLEGREYFEEAYLTEKRKNQFYESSSLDEHTVADEHITVTPYSISTRLKELSDWLLEVIAAGNLEAIFLAATREYARSVEELWNTSAIQITYKRISELQSLPAFASYFLDRVVEISRVDYEPSKLDILYAEGMASTNGLACMEFFYPPSDSGGSDLTEQDTPLRYQLMRLHTKGLGVNLKWLDMFEDVQLVVFCIALSDYGELCETADGEIRNKMMDDMKLFKSVVSHPTYHGMDFLLVLNKVDLLEQMIENSPLTNCEWFDDFDPVISRHAGKKSRSANNCATLAQTAFHYIAVKFKRLFYLLTGRKLYVTLSNGLDSDSAEAALRYAREILKWKEDIPAPNEDMFTTDVFSPDPSSYSH